MIKLVAISLLLLVAISGTGQSVAPPISEYRGKVNGMYEVKNDSDSDMAVVLEVHGFAVDENGNLGYAALDPRIKVELGANSFVIPPHESHFVFYKVSTEKRNGWFTILNQMTRSVPVRNQIRINFVLPHVVYMYQKQKLKESDVEARLSKGQQDGEYVVEVQNKTTKLGRVESVSSDGFEQKREVSGFPVFPGAKRYLNLNLGAASDKASIRISFQDGFSVSASL